MLRKTKKKHFFLSVLPVLLFSNMIIAASPPSFDQAMNSPADQFPSKNKQVGVALEESTSFLDGYAFFNQQLNNDFFYELRGYYIHNYILAIPTIPVGLPSITNQQNLEGTGGVSIFGYNFHVNPCVIAMPFIRLQYLTNMVAPYKDSSVTRLIRIVLRRI